MSKNSQQLAEQLSQILLKEFAGLKITPSTVDMLKAVINQEIVKYFTEHQIVPKDPTRGYEI